MNNREISALLDLYGLPLAGPLSSPDLITTIGSLNDVCEASIRQDENIEALTARVQELERMVQNINFDDYESRNYFDLQLRKYGLFARLEEMGIQDGDTVDIYDIEFEYQR